MRDVRDLWMARRATRAAKRERRAFRAVNAPAGPGADAAGGAGDRGRVVLDPDALDTVDQVDMWVVVVLHHEGGVARARGGEA